MVQIANVISSDRTCRYFLFDQGTNGWTFSCQLAVQDVPSDLERVSELDTTESILHVTLMIATLFES